MTTIREYADLSADHLRFDTLDLFGPAPNARFFSRRLLERFGPFDSRYRLCADCALLMRAALARLPAVTLDEIVYYYRSHPGSTTLGGRFENLAIALDEKLRIADEFLSPGGLSHAERHHLYQAMVQQFTSAVWADFDARRYGEGLRLLAQVHRFPSGAYRALLRHLTPVLLTPVKRMALDAVRPRKAPQ